jgi:hypothetical protein
MRARYAVALVIMALYPLGICPVPQDVLSPQVARCRTDFLVRSLPAGGIPW